MIENASDIITNVETTNGKERIETSFQVDYTFSVGLKGYSWDESNGGKSPTDAGTRHRHQLGQGCDRHQAHRWCDCQSGDADG